jgi:hypothetical protein
VIARWKGIVEEIHFGGSIMPSTIIENLDLEKPSFGPSKWPRKLKPAKNSKLPKWPENCFEPFGKGGWPLISTWIKESTCELKKSARDKFFGKRHETTIAFLDFVETKDVMIINTRNKSYAPKRKYDPPRNYSSPILSSLATIV